MKITCINLLLALMLSSGFSCSGLRVEEHTTKSATEVRKDCGRSMTQRTRCKEQ